MDLRGTFSPAYGGVENTPPSAGPTAPPQAEVSILNKGEVFLVGKNYLFEIETLF